MRTYSNNQGCGFGIEIPWSKLYSVVWVAITHRSTQWSVLGNATKCFTYFNNDALIFLFFKNVVHWKCVDLLSYRLRDRGQEVRWVQIKIITEDLSKLLRSY